MIQQLLIVLAIFAYLVQVMFALIRLFDDGRVMKEYRSPSEFWFMLLVPFLPVLVHIYIRAERIGK